MKFNMPENKAAFVQAKFNQIAQKYDLFNDIVTQGMHRIWKNKVVLQTRLQEGDSVLDVCCGTGDITLRLAKKVKRSGRCVGLDFSEAMLAVAKSRKTEFPIAFEQGDALNLPYQDASFDAITIGYGLRNLENLGTCLQECNRVLKQGGRLVVLDMGEVTYPFIRSIFNFYFFRIVPFLGKLLYPKEDLFDYFPASTINFPSPKALAKKIEEQGFTMQKLSLFYFGSVALWSAAKR